MNNSVGYVLVSQVHRRVLIRCLTPDDHYGITCQECRTPRCVPSRNDLGDRHAHEIEEPNGGTRLGPLHYFQDCGRLSGKAGGNHKRPDSRVVGLPIEFIELLGLPVCKSCEARLAAMEASLAPERAVHAASAPAPTEDSNPLRSVQVGPPEDCE